MFKIIIPPAFGLIVTIAIATSAFAQATADAFAGFRPNNNSPIQIEADSLEVHDKDNLAIFKGNVDVRQGETVMRTVRLTVFYDESASAGGSQGIKRIEASGKVLVESGENKASGDQAIFNMKNQTVVMTGKKVILSQCDNIVSGKKLTVNLIKNTAQLSGGRVSGLLSQGDSGKASKTKCQ